MEMAGGLGSYNSPVRRMRPVPYLEIVRPLMAVLLIL